MILLQLLHLLLLLSLIWLLIWCFFLSLLLFIRRLLGSLARPATKQPATAPPLISLGDLLLLLRKALQLFADPPVDEVLMVHLEHVDVLSLLVLEFLRDRFLFHV
jgi:hypothetical protein